MLNTEILNAPLKFEDAIKYFGKKVPLTRSEYYRLDNEYKTLAFTVSNYSSLEILKQFKEELIKALEKGSTVDEFRKQMNDFLTRKGYLGITPYQADNIFRTNIQTAYNVGHYKRMTQPAIKKLRPYWMYDAVNDRRTRPTHRAMDQRVFPADHPIWDTWYPPNGYRCRCGVRTLSERQVKNGGYTISTEIPKMVEPPGQGARQLIPDPGFDANPAKKAWQPDLSGFPEELKKAFQDKMGF